MTYQIVDVFSKQQIGSDFKSINELWIGVHNEMSGRLNDPSAAKLIAFSIKQVINPLLIVDIGQVAITGGLPYIKALDIYDKKFKNNNNETTTQPQTEI